MRGERELFHMEAPLSSRPTQKGRRKSVAFPMMHDAVRSRRSLALSYYDIYFF
jgi:hypothetical protein